MTVVIDQDTVRIHKEIGELLFDRPLVGDMTLVYEAGYDPLPDMIIYAIMESVKTVYGGKDSDAGAAPIKSERIDGALTVSYDTSGSSSDTGGSGSGGPIVLNPFTNMLDTYRSERAFGAF